MRRTGSTAKMGPFLGAAGATRHGPAHRQPTSQPEEPAMHAPTTRPTDGSFPLLVRAGFAPLLIGAAILVAVVPLAARADHVRPARTDAPSGVVAAYVAAVNAGDLDAILALYADDA